jgi:hypothetical protein
MLLYKVMPFGVLGLWCCGVMGLWVVLGSKAQRFKSSKASVFFAFLERSLFF